MNKNEKGFVIAFVMAVTAALSIMTGAMFFYYDNDLKSVSRNSVMQQVTLAAETGLQEGQKWIADQLNSNTFNLVDIQNKLHVVDSNNACLNRHGFTNENQDIYYAKKIQENLGEDYVKFKDVSYEVFIQRKADIIRSIYFSAQGSKNNQEKDTTYTDRSFALVEKFNEFPTKQFTIEFWINNKQQTSEYNTHLFEFGRSMDTVFKVKNDKWDPRMNSTKLGNSGVGFPIRNKWVHVAWVWDGGNPNKTDTKNVRIYQNGELVGTYDLDVISRKKNGYTNPPESLPEGNDWPLVIGEGSAGFKPNNYKKGKVKIQSTPWLGNIAEMRIWNISRSEDDIARNKRRRLTGSEPGLVSYYKFNEGTGNIAKDSNTSRSSSESNDATIYGLGTVGTLWETKIEYYPLTSTNDVAPIINFPPGEDLVFYNILSCGTGPQGQIVPLELTVSAPVQNGDVGDGKIALKIQDLEAITLKEATPLRIGLADYVGTIGVPGDISIQETNITNTNFFAFKPSMEQCTNSKTFTDFDVSTAYSEEECAYINDKLWMLEKDEGKASGGEFVEEDWSEVLGSGCDGVIFKSVSGDDSYGHYYKYFSTAPNISDDLGYKGDSIDWWEAKRRAEQSTCGGMRGYLVSVETAAENEFIKDAVMCDNSDTSVCDGVIPFHVSADETRENYYGSRLDSKNNQHYIWLANSDWRTPLEMRSESGPNMGSLLSFTSWQGGEPNGGTGGEDYTDMEINRNGRTDGGWNDLHRIPNCNSNGLDCITGYVVEYGGFDSFKLDHDENRDGNKDDPKDLSVETKTCVARATVEKDKYVYEEDYLKYATDAEDASVNVIPAASFDTNSSDDYPGWDVDNGVLTLFHKAKPPEWDPINNYSENDFTWFNNRVWKNISGNDIIGGGIQINQTPTIYNPNVWKLYSGNENDAPCGNLNFWQQAFESIKYINALAVDPETAENPYKETDLPSEIDGKPDDTAIITDQVNNSSLGERVIIFSLGPLHVQKHLDGYNHFYEFYQFPARESGTQNLYNDNNRRMNESFTLSNQLHYFSKTGYLATVTSIEENDILTEKAIGNGWLGGMAQTNNQNSNIDLNNCGGIRKRSSIAVAAKDFQALRQLEKTTQGARVMTATLSLAIDKQGIEISPGEFIIKVDSTLHFPSEGTISIGDELIAYTGKGIDSFTGITRGAFNTKPAAHTLSGVVTEYGFVWSWYKTGETYSGTITSPIYIRNIVAEVKSNTSNITITDISKTNRDTQTIVTTTGAHGLTHDDIVKLTYKDDGTNDIGIDRTGTHLKNYYRVVVLTTNKFVIVDLDSRRNIDTLDITYDPDTIELRELEGIRNEYYRTLTTIDKVGSNPQDQTSLEMFWKDPKVNWSNANDPNTSQNSDCPTWRWVTGPEQFLYNYRGLAFAPSRSHTDTPSANQNSTDPEHTWVRAKPSGEQIGEKFKDGMPFRYWAPGEPNNYRKREPGLHMMGLHFGSSQELRWNDLYNWNANHSNSYGIRGIIVEYGGLESVGDPIARIATKRIINLFDRRVTKATVKITDGKQSGDKLIAGSNDLSELGLTVSGDNTDTLTFTGTGTCKNYLDIIRATTFENTGSEGTRKISVKIGEVTKTSGSDHYFKKVDGNFTYQQADYQASYSNLCGMKGYLANITTTSDLAAVNGLDVAAGEEAWINGTDRCQNGIYRSGFWRYTSGPWKDKEFWRLRINSTMVDIEYVPCNETVLRSSENTVRVGPFESGNWVNAHPAANDDDYLTYLSGSGIKTRDGKANPIVGSYILRYGGSVGDYSGADLEEVNEIVVGAGVTRVEVSFYQDGSENSIYIANEDTLKLPTTGDGALSTDWVKTQDYTSKENPLIITPPTTQTVKSEDWRRELAKVYYENKNINNFTPGNRRIKIVLIYADTTLNDTVGIVKTIGSKNKVTVSPISWSNRNTRSNK